MSGYQKPSPQVPQQEPSLPRKLEANVSEIFKTVEIQIKGNACLIPDEGMFQTLNWNLSGFYLLLKKKIIFPIPFLVTSLFSSLFISLIHLNLPQAPRPQSTLLKVYTLHYDLYTVLWLCFTSFMNKCTLFKTGFCLLNLTT